jgi:4-hydroxy-2-oxoheptanedioate aldolase
MKRNQLRELLNADQPSLGTHLHTTWPSIVEVVAHTGVFDYVEFCAQYGPFDLYALDNFCRAAELHDMSTMIKVDQEPRTFLAQRAIGAGFQSVLFADVRTVEDARACIRAVRPETPEGGGIHGAVSRRSTYMSYGGTADYVQMLDDIVVVLMIEKKEAVDNLEAILALDGIDMIQWGPADYALSIGRPGDWYHPDVRAIERQVFETAHGMGVPARAEINSPDDAQYFLDMGVKHFSLGTDIVILHRWLKENGEALRQALQG